MRKLLLSFTLILATLSTIYAGVIKGDVNGDGKVTPADANLVINKFLGEEVSDFILEAADMNDDGAITPADANAIVNLFLTAEQEQEQDPTVAGTITVTFDGSTANVVGKAAGVTAMVNGADVTITNTNTQVEHTVVLNGTTANGSFTYNGEYKTTIVLSGVSITNPKGAAIDIECGKRVAMELKKGTVNTLTDMKDGKQKAALYCKGHLEIDKTGKLNVTGNTKHAIAAKEYIMLKKSEGTINILGAVSDGIHCGQYFLSNGYTVNIKDIGGDGIQAEFSGAEDYEEDYADGSLTIQGGTYNIDVTSNFAAALKADTDVSINSTKMPTSITITATGDGSRGIDADGSVTISDDATIVGITANGKGGIQTVSTEEGNETPKSYKVYVALTTGTNGGWGGTQGSNYWTTVNLYKSDGTFVATLTEKKTIMGSNGQSMTFYCHDFGAEDSGTYYFRSADYTSTSGGRPGGSGSSTTYTIVSQTFTGPTSGIDYYYQISSSYTTSGSKRTFSIASVQELYGGGTSDADGETYYASCIKADKDVTINGGTLTLANSGLMSKSIKAGNSENIGTMTLNGGNVTAHISGTMYLNGTDASYCSAIKADNYVGNGGTLNVTATTGNASRAITADESISIADGIYTIINSTNGQLGTNDTYTAKAITCDKNISIEGGTFDIRMSGSGGKGIKTDGELTIGKTDGSGPAMKIATTGASLSGGSGSTGNNRPGMGGQTSTSSSSKAIKAVGAAFIKGGSLFVSTATNGAEGLESKTSVTISGGTHYFQCYDDCINSAGIVKFAGGTTVCYANGNDAVDSNYGRTGAITISGGNVFAYTTKGSPEEGLDCDNNSYIVVSGGIAVSAGGAQGGGGTSSIGSASQGYYLGSSPSSYSSSNYYTLCNTSGTPVCTFKFAANVSNTLSLLTAPNLGKGSITVKSGTAKPTASDINVNDVFFINPTVATTATAATLTAK